MREIKQPLTEEQRELVNKLLIQSEKLRQKTGKALRGVKVTIPILGLKMRIKGAVCVLDTMGDLSYDGYDFQLWNKI